MKKAKKRIKREEPWLEIGTCGKGQVRSSLWHAVKFLLRKWISKSQI